MSASPFITAIRRHAAERPRAPALTCGESRLDWAGFAASVEQAAAAFQRHGVSPGDRVAIVAAPSLAYVTLFFGGVAAGACMVPMPNKSGARTLERLIADCATEDPDRGCRGRRDPGGLQAGRRRRDRSRHQGRRNDRARRLSRRRGACRRSRNYRAMRRSTSSIRPARPARPRASFIRRTCGSGRRRETPS